MKKLVKRTAIAMALAALVGVSLHATKADAGPCGDAIEFGAKWALGKLNDYCLKGAAELKSRVDSALSKLPGSIASSIRDTVSKLSAGATVACGKIPACAPSGVSCYPSNL